MREATGQQGRVLHLHLAAEGVVVDGSLDDAKEVLNDVTPQVTVEEVPTFKISPNYKGKNPKTPEELAKIREEKKARRMMTVDSDDKMVNHPSHYKVGKYEAIDIIEEATKDLKGLFATGTGNALKYLLRWNKKGTPIRDLKKSVWYIQHMIEKLESEVKEKE